MASISSLFQSQKPATQRFVSSTESTQESESALKDFHLFLPLKGRHHVFPAVRRLKIEEQVWLRQQPTQLQKVVIFVNASGQCVEKIFLSCSYFVFFDCSS